LGQDAVLQEEKPPDWAKLEHWSQYGVWEQVF